MAKINGRLASLSIQREGVPLWLKIAGGQSITLTNDVELPEVITSDNVNGWVEQLHGTRSWSFEVSGLYDDVHEMNTDALIAAGINEELLQVKFDVAGHVIMGVCRVTNVGINDEMEAPVDYSASFVGEESLES